MNKPHWDAWGSSDDIASSPGKHGAARSVGHGQTEIEAGVRLSWRGPLGRAADYFWRAWMFIWNEKILSRPARREDRMRGRGLRRRSEHFDGLVIGPRGDGWHAYFGDHGRDVPRRSTR